MRWHDHFDPAWSPALLASYRDVVTAGMTGDRQACIDAYQSLPEPDREWMAATVLRGAISLAGGNAYAVPVLSEEVCARIVDWSEGRSWSENADEDADYRMDEIVISHQDPDFDQYLKTVLLHGLAPYLACIFGKLPDQWNSLQMTRYDAGARSGGAYHVDATSKYTAVLSLNTGEFEGGGTRMVSGVFGSVVVPAVPRGWALIFRGREIFHRGEPVTSGTRKLLTVWTDDIDRDAS